MKKFLFIFMLIGMVFVSCDRDKKVVPEQKAELIVENLISTDRQDMFMNYSDNYRWFETCIVLKDYLDSENASDTIVGVSSVFQIVEESEESLDTKVVLISHTLDTNSVEIKYGFWVGDVILNQEAIDITFKDAYSRIMKTNYPKPHSKQCVLREPLGPAICNPQYIFGNTYAQLYVDAITGEVSDTNPAFTGMEVTIPYRK